MTGAERFDRLMSVASSQATLKARSVRSGTFNMVAEGADFLLRIASIAVLARLLVPEHFGLIGMVTAITAIAERFKDMGLSIVTVQREHITHEEVSSLFWINAGLGVASGLVVAALSVPIASFYNDDRLVFITLAIAMTFVWSGLTIQHLALLRRAMRFGTIATIHIGSSAASIVVAIVLAMNDFGYWALVAREVVRSVLVALGMWSFCRWVPARPALRPGSASMLSFGGSLTVVQLATFFSMNFGHIVIGRVFGANAVGMYRQGSQLVLAPISQLVYPIYSVSEVTLSRLQTEPEKYRRYFYKILMLLCSATMPLSAFVFVQSDNIVAIMLGPDWTEAAPFFRILAIVAFLTPAISMISVVMVTCGHSRKYLVLGLASSGAVVLCSLIGVYWGAIGVAAGHVVATYGSLLPRLYWGFRNTPVKITTFFAAAGRPAIASLTMAVVVYFLERATVFDNVVARALLAAAVAAVIYAAAWVSVPGGWRELRALAGDITQSLGLGAKLKRQTP